MKFAEIDQDNLYLIEAYDVARIRIRGRDYEGSLAVSAEQLLSDWGPEDPVALSHAHLEPLLDQDPQVIVVGTGQRQRFPDPSVYAPIMARGIGVEIMDTGAACRTYNILVSEGRRVVAALMLD